MDGAKHAGIYKIASKISLGSQKTLIGNHIIYDYYFVDFADKNIG